MIRIHDRSSKLEHHPEKRFKDSHFTKTNKHFLRQLDIQKHNRVMPTLISLNSFLATALLMPALTNANPLQLLQKRSVTCLTVGNTATARWTNSAGQTCTWSGTVGSNFGTNSVNGGEYVLPNTSNTIRYPG